MPDETRDLLHAADTIGSALVVVANFVLLPLLAVALLAAGHVWAFSLVGAVVALALSRYGPHWWPGRR